jgi:hypothetical protein
MCLLWLITSPWNLAILECHDLKYMAAEVIPAGHFSFFSFLFFLPPDLLQENLGICCGELKQQANRRESHISLFALFALFANFANDGLIIEGLLCRFVMIGPV